MLQCQFFPVLCSPSIHNSSSHIAHWCSDKTRSNETNPPSCSQTFRLNDAACGLISDSLFFCRVVDVVLKTIMRVMWFAGGFHWIRIKGRRALPAEASILTLGPHSSYFDAIPVTMTMASIVMKAESKDIPVWGSKCAQIYPLLKGSKTNLDRNTFLIHSACSHYHCIIITRV